MSEVSVQWLDGVADAVRDVLVRHDACSSACLWAAAPALLFGAGYEGTQPRSRTLEPVTAPAKHWATVASTTRGPSAILHAGVLFVYDQVNPRLTLDAVIDARVPGSGSLPRRMPQPARPRRLATWTRQARRHALLTERALADKGLRAPAALSQTLLASARALTRAEALLSLANVDCLVVATQHGTSARAYLHCARVAGVPSVYLPHAPVADNVQYRDLPSDYVGLRGLGEVAFYRDLGVARHLDVVGNPAATVSISSAQMASSVDARRTVFAPSPVPVRQLQPQVDLVRKVFGADVTLAPHPAIRHRKDYEALWPDWSIHPGRTLDLLQAGVGFLIQSSSGVAWEAIAHGIPTVELSFGNGPAGYPFIREPEVPYVRDEEELRRAFDRAMQEPKEARSDRTEWANHWCSETGAASARLAAALIDRAVLDGVQHSSIWDAWRPVPD